MRAGSTWLDVELITRQELSQGVGPALPGRGIPAVHHPPLRALTPGQAQRHICTSVCCQMLEVERQPVNVR